MRIYLFILIFSLCVSCSPKITTNIINHYPSLQNNDHVSIIGVYDTIPKSAEILGTTIVGDKGLTVNCDLKTMMDIAKSEARKIGGNCLKLTKLKAPNPYSSSCFRISAQILKVNTFEKKKRPISNEYALVHVYRFNDAKVEFELHLGDSLLGLVKNNWKKSFRIYKEGPNFLWVKGFKKSISIDIQKGKEYFVFCHYLFDATYEYFLMVSLEGEENGTAALNSIQLNKYNFVDILALKKGGDLLCFIDYEDKERVYYSIYRKKEIIKESILKSELREIVRNN